MIVVAWSSSPPSVVGFPFFQHITIPSPHLSPSVVAAAAHPPTGKGTPLAIGGAADVHRSVVLVPPPPPPQLQSSNFVTQLGDLDRTLSDPSLDGPLYDLLRGLYQSYLYHTCGAATKP